MGQGGRVSTTTKKNLAWKQRVKKHTHTWSEEEGKPVGGGLAECGGGCQMTNTYTHYYVALAWKHERAHNEGRGAIAIDMLRVFTGVQKGK